MKLFLLFALLFFSISSISQMYVFDAIGRLESFSIANTITTYSYDANGNRKSSTVEYQTLPVSLLNFIVQKSKSEVLLNWSVTKEMDVKYFEVEFSIDGTHFSKIATVNANGLMNRENDYNSSHCCPISGINYYRLKMVANDEKFIYSPVRSVVFDNTLGMKVYPNPSNKNTIVTLSFSSPLKVQSSLYIYSLLGEVIKKETVPKATKSYQVAETSFSTGEYIVVVKTGETIMTSKLVISY